MSLFDDGSVALNFFAGGINDESISGGHHLYGPGGFTSKRVNAREMVSDIKWAVDRADKNAASWDEGQDQE